MKLDNLINDKFPSFTEGERFLAKFILENKEKIEQLNINELAQESLTSKSSVLRFAQKLGFSGYTEFKNFLKWEMVMSKPSITHYDMGNQIIDNVRDTVNYFNELDLSRLYQSIDTSEHIYLIGTGLAQKNYTAELQRIFWAIGKEMQILPFGMNTDLYQLIIERMSDKDLLIIFSHSGNNPHLMEALSIPILKKVKMLAITSNPNNWLVEHSTFSIPTQTEQPVKKIYNLFNSSISYHVIIELLAFGFIEYKNSKD